MHEERSARAHFMHGGLTVLRDGVDDAGEASAGLGGRLIHTLPQRLQPVHVDHRRGYRHHHAQHRRDEAEATAQFHL